MPSLRRTVPFVVLSLSAACGPMHRGGPPGARIVFANESLDQADVYAIASSGAQTRIGTVTAGRTETLRIPATAAGGDNSVNIVARLLARSYTPSTGRFTLSPDDVMRVTLTTDARFLTLLPEQ